MKADCRANHTGGLLGVPITKNESYNLHGCNTEKVIVKAEASVDYVA